MAGANLLDMTSATQHGDSGTVPFLESRYVLGDLIGEGSIGLVYTALDTVLGIQVAVKVMRLELTSSRRQVERFTLEASLVGRMLSPHVVKVLGLAVTHEGAPCIIYEHLVGETLAMRIHAHGTLSLSETTTIVKQTSLALARAHAVGVVHLDVKPENIFLVEQPGGRFIVKLIDFGIAERLDDVNNVTRTELVGTPEYIAPEVMFGQQPDARADIYALGVVAFECLTGRCPFPGEDIGAVIDGVRSGRRASLADFRPELGSEMNEWMERAIHSDPFWRFETAKDLAGAMGVAARAAVQPAAQPEQNVVLRAA